PRRGINPLPQRFSHDGVIFNNGYSDHECPLVVGKGSSSVTVVPAPGAEVTSHWPLRFSSRSRKFKRPWPLEPPLRSKPEPLSFIDIGIRSGNSRTRNPISVAPPWRTALLSASFTARKR